MKEKIEAIAKRLSALGIEHQSKSLPDNELIQIAARIDHLSHVVYAAIEDQYSKYNPKAEHEEQIAFFCRILDLKNTLRSIQTVHNDLTKSLYEKSELYIANENNISLKEKYILPELKGKEPKKIVRANFYQLLDNIKKNNCLSDEEFNFISSLLMQMASRPEGIKLIIKLNYLLTTQDAKLILKNSNNFECSMSAKGFAKKSPDYPRKSMPNRDFRSVFKDETLRGEGSDSVSVGVDFRYNDKLSSLSLEAYASPEHGITDIGPPFILFAHELIHGIHNLSGKARHNFDPFFQSHGYREDLVMRLLYPTKSLYSYGPSAEEYWTIEGGNLCENSLRKEHGYSSRTGHISAEPGSRAIRDLYYLGLARSNTPERMQSYESYMDNSAGDDEITEE